jgi:hypothetical protein
MKLIATSKGDVNWFISFFVSIAAKEGRSLDTG